MKNQPGNCFLLGFFFITCNFGLIAQEDRKQSLQIDGGLTYYFLNDHLVENKTYSGDLSYFGFGWKRYRQHSTYYLNASLQNGQVSRSGLSADLVNFQFRQGFLYNLPDFKLFDKPIQAKIGPGLDLFFQWRNQNLQGELSTKPMSTSLLLSGAVMAQLNISLNDKLTLENNSSINLLTFAGRLVHFTDEYQLTKVQSVFSIQNFHEVIMFRYRLTDRISPGLGYQLQIVHMNNSLSQGQWEDQGWTNFTSIDNQLFLSLRIDF